MQHPFCAGKSILLGVTGSIAAYKALELLRELRRLDLRVCVSLTEAARQFVTPLSFKALGADKVYEEQFDQRARIYDHLEPGQGFDACVIAPCTANFLAKLSLGLADDLLSTQTLAFPKPMVVAPAMNPLLWEATTTREHLSRLRNRGHCCVEPGSGVMACGDNGQGRLADVSTILAYILRSLAPQDMAGMKVLVTLGPTREHWDPVRFWSNPSSGRMGAALANAAWLRGAEVHAVCGPTAIELHPGVQRYDTPTAIAMYDKSMELWPECDLACCTAAVADFRPRPYGDAKFKKHTVDGELKISFDRNPDILQSLGERKSTKQKTIGFAAETGDAQQAAEHKLQAKHADMIVCNLINQPGSGFGVETNQAFIVDALGKSQETLLVKKEALAWEIWSWALGLGT